MKKLLLLIGIWAAVISCSKDANTSKEFETSHAIIIQTGVLHYDNFPDGWGLYYRTDSNENLILQNPYGSESLLYEHYKTYVGKHTEVSFKYTGNTDCLYGIGPVCGVPVVEVVSLK